MHNPGAVNVSPLVQLEADDREPFRRYSTFLSLHAMASGETNGETNGNQLQPAREGMQGLQMSGEAHRSSIFGLDRVMEREINKLEKILQIEEAERKIKAETERVGEAKWRHKEAKREAKEERRRKKQERKEKAASTTLRRNSTPLPSTALGAGGRPDDPVAEPVDDIPEIWPPPLERSTLIDVPTLPPLPMPSGLQYDQETGH
jgi:hypothetical protein